MDLSSLRPPRGAKKKPTRVGRGIGARKSKTAGRGSKGQRSRSGYSQRPGFEGGQMPLYRRVPKRGFTNIFRKEFAIVNVATLNKFSAGTRVTPEELTARGVVKNPRDAIKILGDGELKVKLTVAAHAFSAGARAKIEAVGGSVEVLGAPRRAQAGAS